MKTIVSGIKPSGKLHLGNYLGAVKQFFELQKKHTCYFFIADLHSLTETYDPKEKADEIFNLAVDLLALGLDPKKCVFFVQSRVPQCLQLAWIFSCLTPVSFLERMTQYKDFISRREQTPNAGLLTYPILQAADILLYHGNLVPVGKDQLQHLELTNDIVKFFNNKFNSGKNEYFAPIKPLLTQTPKIMSLTEPEKKMSKSLGPKSYIALRDEPEIIFEKIKKAPTGTGQEASPPPGALNLLELFKQFGSPKQVKYFEDAMKNKTIQYGKLKESLAKAIAESFAPFRKNYKKLEQNRGYVKKVLKQGQEKASKAAEKTLTEVKKIVGLAQ
ncbi:MAG: tryptophan--tRNA ligase [bacterium]|nr:tryptophan--tRNA ligase [bacterium]